MSLTTGLAIVVALGVFGQVIARRINVPSILVLLGLGLVIGPLSGVLDPDEVFGTSLFPVVSLGVGLLLFEESLKLDARRLRGGARRPVVGLVTVGALITGVGASLAAYWVLDVTAGEAAVIGSIVIVSGPTVVGPLLSIIRPREPVGSVLAFEGIFIDPIGATIALTVANVVLYEEAPRLFTTAFTGLWTGLLAAAVYVVVVRWGRVPPGTEVILAVAFAFVTFAGAEEVQSESGLWAMTTLGVVLANQRLVPIEPLHEFGGHLGMLLVGSLFILLSARVDVGELITYGGATVLIVVLLVLVVRPVATAVATAGTSLDRRERGLVAWMAPRGIVAASTASVFALEFEEAGRPFPELVPVVFGIIVLTALVYGLSGPAVAKALGLRSGDPEPLDDDGVPVSVPGESTARLTIATARVVREGGVEHTIRRLHRPLPGPPDDDAGPTA
ncbi:NhaP-type Na+/H+ or K+/H+ antiporter [Paraoerskovia marina]|uniref:NhaP-type Na+/H+ or K+/H+ antiporter n=1 Tax=Paraoerskovia marina TaxID=545619 RepID=A0A1H1NB70_9CELL|nr:cation:proton antiporter [Paraoerskovia marina]SDR96148.1 NhaP-type Na+/H+ or K+/H+ antiporter [Paraoerskovia marina]